MTFQPNPGIKAKFISILISSSEHLVVRLYLIIIWMCHLRYFHNDNCPQTISVYTMSAIICRSLVPAYLFIYHIWYMYAVTVTILTCVGLLHAKSGILTCSTKKSFDNLIVQGVTSASNDVIFVSFYNHCWLKKLKWSLFCEKW